MWMLLPGQLKMMPGVKPVYTEHVPALYRYYAAPTFCNPTLPTQVSLLFPRASKSKLLRCQSFTSDASEDVEAALEERTCLPLHSFVLFLLVWHRIPRLFKTLIGILQNWFGIVDGSNLQGGRGRAIVDRIIPGFLPHSLQFMLLWRSKAALNSVAQVRRTHSYLLAAEVLISWSCELAERESVSAKQHVCLGCLGEGAWPASHRERTHSVLYQLSWWYVWEGGTNHHKNHRQPYSDMVLLLTEMTDPGGAVATGGCQETVPELQGGGGGWDSIRPLGPPAA